VTSALDGIRVVLLDIEGTTTPIAFVHERLFGFVRSHVETFLSSKWNMPAVQEAVEDLAAEHRHDRATDSLPDWRDDTPVHAQETVATYARWLMERDRKSPGLKALQGLIWQDAYLAGELRGEVFSDVPRAMERWHAQGRRIAIYSSGSVLAQQLLFSSTSAGDLTPLIDAYFDTAVGSKKHADSYRAISASLGCQPNEILFLSDVTAELSAATLAGCSARLCMRSGNTPQPDADRFAQLADFDAL